MSGYLKQKLYEAVYTLVSSDDLDKRLTFAGTSIIAVQDRDVPGEFQERFSSIRERMFATPLSSERSYVPRQMSEEHAKTLARDIVDLYTAVMGGL